MSEVIQPIVILRRSQVEQRIQLSRSTIYDKLDPNSPRHDRTFPKPIKLGAGSSAIGFIESEVSAWLEQQMRARDGEPS